ncbi:hypothetical protein INT48_005752 [Thamnidium elegans]|uniref:Uncharacterized protein n=1 Tax=Thamnidium elegans TaxID=101142 RepID=A0A8H7VXV2_9FUNG|nr:hypothetical protein INT48_005752 [Thamnidium elegans]
MDFINYIPDENYNNFKTEGMEVDKIAVEFGGIEMLRGNEYLVEDTPQSTVDEKTEEMVLELEEMTIIKTKRYKRETVPKAAETCGMPTRLLNQFNDNNGTILPDKLEELELCYDDDPKHPLLVTRVRVNAEHSRYKKYESSYAVLNT